MAHSVLRRRTLPLSTERRLALDLIGVWNAAVSGVLYELYDPRRPPAHPDAFLRFLNSPEWSVTPDWPADVLEMTGEQNARRIVALAATHSIGPEDLATGMIEICRDLRANLPNWPAKKLLELFFPKTLRL